MATTLSQEKITYLEDFIKKTVPRKSGDILSNVSIGDVICGLDIYKKMKDGEIDTKYYKFGENGMGYTVYSLYKSISGKIYLIHVDMQTPYAYAVIENETEFEGYYFIPK
jgi:hypothetical protein